MDDDLFELCSATRPACGRKRAAGVLLNWMVLTCLGLAVAAGAAWVAGWVELGWMPGWAEMDWLRLAPGVGAGVLATGLVGGLWAATGRGLAREPLTPAELRQRSIPPRQFREAIVEVGPGTGFMTSVPAGGPQAPDSHRSIRRSVAPRRAACGDLAASERIWQLRFDTGQTCMLRGTALLGRAPAERLEYAGAELMRVEDGSMTVSGTHLAVGSSSVGVWVSDLGSTNGSAVVTPHGRESALHAGKRVTVPIGGRVRLGDRIMCVQEEAWRSRDDLGDLRGSDGSRDRRRGSAR